ncbi:hypothetical protein ACB098_08G098900 [Castanea mollissima]
MMGFLQTAFLLCFLPQFPKSGREVVRNAITSLTSTRYHVMDSAVPTLGNWWEILRQYRDNSNNPVTDTVDVGAECFYTGPHLNMTWEQVAKIGQSVFNKTYIDGYGGKLNCTQVFEVNDNTIYHFLFSKHVMFLDSKEQRELMDKCSGNLMVELSTGKTEKMVWARERQIAGDQCSTFLQGDFYLGLPNRDERIDSLVNHMLANIAQEATNKGGRGWLGNYVSGLTVTSYCAYLRNVSFNAVGLKGYRYMLPYIWDQNIRNCALKPSESYGTDSIILKQPRGYVRARIIVNHTDAKFISSINFLSVAADSNDFLEICDSESNPKKCSSIQSNNGNFDSNFKLMSSKAFIEFNSGDPASFESRGWEFSYTAGICNGKKNLYDHLGIIGYPPSTSISFIEGLSYQWILHGKQGTLVSLSFTHINISKDLDFIAIFNSKKKQIANFSGLYSKSHLPQMNLTGKVMVAFYTQTDKGNGWSADFHIPSPINRNENVKDKQKNKMHSDEGIMLTSLEINAKENRIGEGPSAIVYRAAFTDGRLVAIKFLRDTASRTQLREEILHKLSSHPNIISLLGQAQDRLWRRCLVFEFMGSGSLSWNLRERAETLDWDKRLVIALQVCSAIQQLHLYLKPPVYHGNITSENVLLDEFCNANLGGFGAANYCSNDRTNPGQLSEMAEDIWSLGLLLLELLKGKPLADRDGYKNFRSMEERYELVGGQESFDERLDIPKDKCKIMALAKYSEIAKWCINSSWSFGKNQDYPKIVDVLSGLTQVKQLFSSASC